MTQNKVVSSMFAELMSALEQKERAASLMENYEHQCVLYERLIDSAQKEKELVCGRCLIALSRSLASEKITDESISAVKNEVKILSGVFSKEGKPNKKQIDKLVRSRIEELSLEPSDAVYDAILFLYLSLR